MRRFFACTSCLLPEQAIVVKDGAESAAVLQPREVGAHCAADEHVLLKVHHEIKAPEQLLQDRLERLRFLAELRDDVRDLEHLVDVVLRERGDVLRGRGVRGHEGAGGERLDHFERVQVGCNVVEEANLVLFQRLPARQAVGQIYHVVRRAKAHHVEKVPRQRKPLKSLRQARRGQLLRVAGLGHEELVLQLLRRIAAVEKRRLEHRVAREIALDAGGVDLAAGLVLQVLVAADVVGVGVRVVDGSQVPAVGVEDLAHLAPGLLVVAAVDEADVGVVQAYEADLGRALDVVAVSGHLGQFIHGGVLPCQTVCLRMSGSTRAASCASAPGSNGERKPASASRSVQSFSPPCCDRCR